MNASCHITQYKHDQEEETCAIGAVVGLSTLFMCIDIGKMECRVMISKPGLQ